MNSKDNQSWTAHSLRIHRAQSWLEKANHAEDDDIRFLTLWIAFNAAYARELVGVGVRSTDKGELSRFIAQICRLDKDKRIYQLVWQRFSRNIRTMLNNRYVFKPFWDYHNGLISESAWLADFDKAKRKINTALKHQDTHGILTVVFERIYTLRNQIVHGGASFNSSANREQVRSACGILSALLPLMIEIIQNHSDKDWGKPFYPFIAEE